MRRSFLLRAEFERAAKVRPKPKTKRTGPDPSSPPNYLWKMSVVRQTTDANRLVSASRYQFLVDRIRLPDDDATKLTDLRKDDFRFVEWKCACCGASYRRSVKGAVYFGKHVCDGCLDFNVYSAPDRKSGSPRACDVLSKEHLPVDPDVALDTVPATSSSKVLFKCADCGTEYRESLRARTNVDAGAHGLVDDAKATAAFSRCPRCRFTAFAKRSTSFLDSVRYE
uniref:Treble clef zinc finger domain-containing protein n=1 Tax=Neobodo designis TaxID=312471 RepID=A0A7S1QDE7_NEODS